MAEQLPNANLKILNLVFEEPQNTQPIIPIVPQPIIPIVPQSIINHGHQILTIRLSDTNYLLWRQQVTTAVRGYGLTEILLPTGPSPPATVNGLPNPDFDH